MPSWTAGNGCAGRGCWGSDCMMPGSRNDAGEILRVALIPLQPVQNHNKAGKAASRRIFQYDLTAGQYIVIIMPLANCIWWGVVLCSVVASSAAEEVLRASLAQQELARAQAQYQKEPHNVDAAWQYARACFDLADTMTNKAECATTAERGIEVSQQALPRATNSAPLHYYLGLNLGQLARTRGLSALKLVDQMERELLRAATLDPKFDYAGPDRSLGLLYVQAPAVVSVGSRFRARQHLVRAVELAPEYPENHLNLVEAYLQWGERDAARRELKTLEQDWASARGQLTGPAWAANWAEWEARLLKAKKKLEESPKLQSPRH
jgi:tetratricopeptide (TPR) repeat protein